MYSSKIPYKPKLIIEKVYCVENSLIFDSYIQNRKTFAINDSIMKLLNSFELDKVAEHIASYTNTKIACKRPYSTYYCV
uniref:Uncharacterized protein n=1 Tax=viral metagenome TaxID=1070528 RepID=A0A6C0CJA9_9ZZZZ